MRPISFPPARERLLIGPGTSTCRRQYVRVDRFRVADEPPHPARRESNRAYILQQVLARSSPHLIAELELHAMLSRYSPVRIRGDVVPLIRSSRQQAVDDKREAEAETKQEAEVASKSSSIRWSRRRIHQCAPATDCQTPCTGQTQTSAGEERVMIIPAKNLDAVSDERRADRSDPEAYETRRECPAARSGPRAKVHPDEAGGSGGTTGTADRRYRL